MTTHNIEAKYPYFAGNCELLRRAITTVCLPDGRFAEDDVNSIYFDDPSRMLLSQKENSEYLKTKIRVRWYGNLSGKNDGAETMAFVERKSKQGTWRIKPRIEVKIPSVLLREQHEDLEAVAQAIAGPLKEIAPDLGHLFPMIVIRYRRVRFIEPLTASRLSLDAAIRFTTVNTSFFPSAPSRVLSNGVLEVKNSDGCLPLSLLAARYYLLARDSFSKYEECWQAHENPNYHRNFRWTHFEK